MPARERTYPAFGKIAKADTDYFAADKQFMINFRVSDLDALLETLRAAGIEAIIKPEWDDPQVSRFARIHDPEGQCDRAVGTA